MVSAGGTVLIDTGLITEGSKNVSFLESRNIHKLDWLIITVTHGKNRFLFPGDAVSERITEKKYPKIAGGRGSGSVPDPKKNLSF